MTTHIVVNTRTYVVVRWRAPPRDGPGPRRDRLDGVRGRDRRDRRAADPGALDDDRRVSGRVTLRAPHRAANRRGARVSQLVLSTEQVYDPRRFDLICPEQTIAGG